MLGTIIEKLSSLLSKGAFISSFVPLIAFLTANTLLLAAVHPPFRDWVSTHRADAEVVSGTVIAFLISAFMFATINTRLRELMEGRFWPQWLCRTFIRSEQLRMNALTETYATLQRSRRVLERESPRWPPQLKRCREEDTPKVPGRGYNENGRVGTLIRELCAKRLRGEIILADELKSAVAQLCEELRLTPISPALDSDQVELNGLIDYARAKTRQEAIRVFNERQFGFPDQFPAPTAMGNVALSVRSYALSRYQFNIESLWTRLQKVMQNEPFYVVLQDAKTQLDFLVSMFWLSGVFTVLWLILLAAFGHSLMLFLSIALLGPFLVWSSYALSLQNYRAFADLMRSAVDMYRFSLLKELRLPEPAGSREEALLWQALQDRMDYAKDFNLSYRRSP